LVGQIGGYVARICGATGAKAEHDDEEKKKALHDACFLTEAKPHLG
jgi:hypothetical protein